MRAAGSSGGRASACRTSCPRSSPQSRWAGAWLLLSGAAAWLTEAGAAALDFGFGPAGLERIVSIFEPENVPSGRVMEHLGFTLSATGLATESGELVTVMELHRADWESRAARG